MVDKNPPYAILPQRGKELGGHRIVLAGEQLLEQRPHARVGRDVDEVQRGVDAVAVVLTREAHFAGQFGFNAHQVAA